MKAIVCVDNNWAIGNGKDLLYHIPEDMKHFKEKTLGNVVIMGLATFYSLPNQKPLRDRVNIVLCDDPNFSCEGVITCSSIEDLFEYIKRYDTQTVYVIGGASIYAQLVPYCSTVYVTIVDSEKPADKFFPNLDEDENFAVAKESEEFEYEGLKYRYLTYKNI